MTRPSPPVPAHSVPSAPSARLQICAGADVSRFVERGPGVDDAVRRSRRRRRTCRAETRRRSRWSRTTGPTPTPARRSRRTSTRQQRSRHAIGHLGDSRCGLVAGGQRHGQFARAADDRDSRRCSHAPTTVLATGALATVLSSSRTERTDAGSAGSVSPATTVPRTGRDQAHVEPVVAPRRVQLGEQRRPVRRACRAAARAVRASVERGGVGDEQRQRAARLRRHRRPACDSVSVSPR